MADDDVDAGDAVDHEDCELAADAAAVALQSQAVVFLARRALDCDLSRDEAASCRQWERLFGIRDI